ncbi:hypothetical protein Aph01nite_46030 [Acrocarpospora phusangensis]|uniref:Glycosyl transferase family 28 C-terminal domain-containing protein n=1 Tax=Acrocarpospora phusangensis TaxID=1070424 RepID=A0A919QEZ9_9ACTN|nr:hypothetical protein [Acrocarpospora phusangensis]GIH26293.1 hypothetical protein Aph01nite_46030 [Acrocarpospora phusangensis]
MTPTVAFFFKARHGFGHVRRTLLIADALHALEPSAEIFLIGQVRSLLPFRGCPYPVINFPHLHRLPNDAMEASLRKLLNHVIAEIGPSLIVEDTFPDANHLFLPAVREVPKALVLRKLSGVFFERMRQRGDLRHYDRILVAQDRASFATSGHSPDSLLLAEHSSRFRFFGPVFNRPNPSETAAVARRYGPGPLVVVAAGAGGDSGDHGYPERLFMTMSAIARRSAARFVFVTGPYYGGAEPPALENVTTVSYEPSLAALLHVAKVAVIRPGFNSLHEAVSGPARVILVPGHNTAEDQWGDAHRLSAQDGIDVSPLDDADRLEKLVLTGLQATPRVPPPTLQPAQRNLAAALLDEIRLHIDPWAKPVHGVFLLAGGLGTPERQAVAAEALPGMPQVGDDVSAYDQTISAEALPGTPRVAGDATAWDQAAVADTPRVVGHARANDQVVAGVRATAPRQADPVHPGHGSDPGSKALFLDVAPSVDTTPASLHARGVRVLFLPERDDYDDQAGPQLRDWLLANPLSGQGVLPVRLHHFHADDTRPGEFRYRLGRLRERTAVPAMYLDLSGVSSAGRLAAYLQEIAAWLAVAGLTPLSLDEYVGRLAMARLGGGADDDR